MRENRTYGSVRGGYRKVSVYSIIEVSMMLEILKTRFLEHRNLHPGLEWSEVEHRLREAPAAIAVLQKMEESGGEPDTIGYDEKTGKLIFCDCAKESPSGRRSLCYDEKALQGRAKNAVRQCRTESERNRRFNDDGGTLSSTAKSRLF